MYKKDKEILDLKTNINDKLSVWLQLQKGFDIV